MQLRARQSAGEPGIDLLLASPLRRALATAEIGFDGVACAHLRLQLHLLHLVRVRVRVRVRSELTRVRSELTRVRVRSELR